MSILYRGHIFHLTGIPRVEEAAGALVEIPDGAIQVDDAGIIEWSGAYADRPTPTGGPIEVVDYHDCFILPGFIDTHIHFA
ncbi:MAG: guanine deaminase, partial [Candidatus Auribacterota bacterium]|nr:guanine deaminase [Candidatus Auribacterota bacterium]